MAPKPKSPPAEPTAYEQALYQRNFELMMEHRAKDRNMRGIAKGLEKLAGRLLANTSSARKAAKKAQAKKAEHKQNVIAKAAANPEKKKKIVPKKQTRNGKGKAVCLTDEGQGQSNVDMEGLSDSEHSSTETSSLRSFLTDSFLRSFPWPPTFR